MNPENEQVLERFAAGELSVTEENDFLARCEIDPARYRAATLALVEHRRISDALAEFTFPEDRVAAVVPSEQPLPQPNRSGSRTSLFALAATIAAVACGGYLLGMLGNREDNLQNIAVVDPTPVAPSDQQNLAVSAQQAPTPIDVNPFAIVPDAPASADRPADKTHDPRFVELPPEATDDIAVGPENQAARQLGGLLAELFRGVQRDPIFNDQAKSKLRRDGWEVEENPLIYVFSTDDGHQYAVPTQNANLRYVKP